MNTIKIIKPANKKELEDYYHLRWLVLRKPWNKEPGTERDQSDAAAVHFMAVIDDKPIGVARLHYNSEQEAQLRYMAIHEDFQQKGIGKALLDEIEKEAKSNGAKELILHARGYAVNFYKKNNYLVVEKSYLLFDSIQHYLMKKEF